VLATVTDVRESLAKRSAAVRVLLRTLLDRQCAAGDVPMAELLRTVCRTLLRSSSADVRVHAFDLLFNLSVHLHLVEESAVLEFTRAAERPEQRAEALRRAEARNERLESAQRRVFGVLCELLLALVHQHERDSAVLQVALSCMLYACIDGSTRACARRGSTRSTCACCWHFWSSCPSSKTSLAPS
jgi:hypothetical protein